MKTILGLSLCVFLSFGISHAYASTGASHSEVIIPVPVDVAWQRLTTQLKTDKTEIYLLDKKRGIVQTSYQLLSKQELPKLTSLPHKSQSGGWKSPWLWARYKTTYHVEPNNTAKSKISISIRYEAWSPSAGRYVRVISNGTKEKDLLSRF